MISCAHQKLPCSRKKSWPNQTFPMSVPFFSRHQEPWAPLQRYLSPGRIWPLIRSHQKTTNCCWWVSGTVTHHYCPHTAHTAVLAYCSSIWKSPACPMLWTGEIFQSCWSSANVHSQSWVQMQDIYLLKTHTHGQLTLQKYKEQNKTQHQHLWSL